MQRSDLGSDCHSHYKYNPELDTLHPRIEDEVRLADTFGGAPPVPKGRPGIYSRCIEGTLVGRAPFERKLQETDLRNINAEFFPQSGAWEPGST